MDLKLTGKTALVTGASRGLGKAIAESLAGEGCNLILVARRPDLLNDLADDLGRRADGRVSTFACDITDADAPERISEHTAALGGADILINNAGGSRPLAGYGEPQDWIEAMQLNFHAARNLTHALVDNMIERGYGRIVNITGGDEPSILNAAVPPNGATHLWAKALSRRVAADGITVNSISPGRIHSDQIDNYLLPTPQAQEEWVASNIPAGYIANPEDFAPLVTFLVSAAARYITGQVIHVDGGARRYAF